MSAAITRVVPAMYPPNFVCKVMTVHCRFQNENRCAAFGEFLDHRKLTWAEAGLSTPPVMITVAADETARLIPPPELVASGGKGIITSFATLMSDVLERTIWGVQFFMLCDRDAVSLARSAADVENAGRRRLKVLRRYHLENYFLDETILAAIFETMEPDGSWLRSPARIKERLEDLARSMISYATALIVSAQYREQTGNVDMMPDGCHEKSADQLVSLMVDRLNSEKTRVAAVLDPLAIESSVRAEYQRLVQSIEGGQDEWKNVIPGKQLLRRFASLTNLDAARLKRLYLQVAAARTPSPFEDIVRIFDSFDRA